MKPQEINPTNQNPTPDYDFIVNQPEVPKKKKLSKKTAIIIILVVFTLIMFGVIFLTKDDNLNTNQNNSQNSPVTVEDNVSNFLNAIANGNYDQAYELMTKSETENDKQIFTSLFAPVLNENVDLKSCEILETNQEADIYLTRITCNNKGEQTQASYEVKSMVNNGQPKVISINGVASNA